MSKQCIIIGGGPAGLMAAEQLTKVGIQVDLYDAMPTVGRKFLLAGIGGLNITHSESLAPFLSRYTADPILTQAVKNFDNQQIQQWCHALGIETFTGTSGRVFPNAMKAAPLLRAWLARLRTHGLRIHTRHRWQGWDEQGRCCFSTPKGEINITSDCIILALGGGSWKKLGSDGAWLPLLQSRGIKTQNLQASNGGFLCDWSDWIKAHAGSPIKSVSLSFTDQQGETEKRQGELILSEYGVEGSLIYAFSTRLRNSLNTQGAATFHLDLCPHQSVQQLTQRLSQKPKKKSLSSFLKSGLKLDAAKTALLFESLAKTEQQHSHAIAEHLKAIPITIIGMRPIDEAISTTGGVCSSALNQNLMLKALPGVFCTGEMLDWDAPTGGYLLTACLALGRQAGLGAARWLEQAAS